MLRRFLFAAAIMQLLLFARVACAGHPMLSEDTGTQGAGNAELELGFAWSRNHGDRFFLFQPQLSYGAASTLDFIAQPSWLHNDASTHGSEQGFGDTNLDMKWRFYGNAPLSLAVRAGFELPTSQYDLSLPHGEVSTHSVLVATLDTAPLTLDTNIGYTFNPNGTGLRTDVYHFSAAAMYAVNESAYLIVDTAADSSADPQSSHWSKVGLAGIIYTLAPSLDIDAGYRTGLNSAAIAKQWLLGITYRWAP